MQLKDYRRYLAILYSDLMAVYKHVETENEDGSTDGEDLQLKKADNPCRASFKSLDVPPGAIEGGAEVTTQIKVFCDVDVDVLQGDYIVITRMDGDKAIGNYEGYAGMPAEYGTHKEIILVHRGRA